MKKSILAIALPLFLATPASAATYNLGVIGVAPAPLGALTSQTGTLTASNPSDRINFSLSEPVDLVVAPNKFQISFNGLTFFDMTSLTAELFYGLTSLGTIGSANSLVLSSLGAGDYHVNINGTPTGIAGGFYSLSLFAAPAAPVPGPAGFLVFGAGAAAVTYMRKRKSKASAA